MNLALFLVKQKVTNQRPASKGRWAVSEAERRSGQFLKLNQIEAGHQRSRDSLMGRLVVFKAEISLC